MSANCRRRCFSIAPISVIAVVLLGLAGCGGGGNSSNSSAPPPPDGDFSLSVDSTTVALQQQGISQIQSISATPLNGFTGTVTVTMSGLPAGVTATPSGPYSISTTGPAQGVSFQLAASSSAAINSSTITLTGTSGSKTHTATFNVVLTQVAPFAIQVSPTSLSLNPGSLATVQISVTANPDTSPSLLTNISNPPSGSGVTVNPPESLLSPSNPVKFSIVVGALAQSLQNFPLQISASDNSGNTSALVLPFTVNVPSETLGPTRSTFVRTDNNPTGAVYDAARKLVFVTVQSLNQVKVFSSTDSHLVATISTEQPLGIDETADGTKVIVGSQSAYVSVIDPNLLQVVEKVRTPPVPNPPAGETDYYFLTQPATLSNAKVLFVAQHGYTTEMHVFLWDLVAGTITLDDFPQAITYAQTLTRSGDHSKVLFYGVSSTGATAALYDAASDTYTAQGSFNGAYHLAINPDGSQIFAAGIQGNTTAFYNSSFGLLGSLTTEAFPVSGAVYSRDGNHAYVSGTVETANVVIAINAETYSIEGVVPDVSSLSDATVPYDIDETGMIFGAGALGVAWTDVSSPGFYAYPTPVGFQVQPSLLSTTAPTPTQLIGDQFAPSATYSVFFGAPPASGAADKGTGVSVQSPTALSLTAPTQAVAGPVNVTLTRSSDGWYQLSPDAATYGPKVLFVQPSAGPASGGASITLYGYGLASAGVQVSIGGKSASINSSGSIGISPFPFPLSVAVVTAPSGSAGYADITVSTPAGSSTVSNGFQYLASAQVYPVSGALDDIVYDQARQVLYATNTPLNRVEIFSLATQQYLSPINVGNQPAGLAITPDDSLLAVVNSGDGTVSKITLANNQVAATYSVVTASDGQGVAVSIAPVAPHRMMIDGISTGLAFAGFMHLLDLDTGLLSCTGFVTCSPNGTNLVIGSGLQAMSSTPDGKKVFLTDTSGDIGSEGGLVTLIDIAANTAAQNEFGGNTDSAANADATIFATNFGFHDSNNIQFSVASDVSYFSAAAASLTNLVGEKLSPSGSLLFVPLGTAAATNGLGMDIFDVHRGRLAVGAALPEQIPQSLNAMALDETGTKMFVISNSGITIATLFQAPLSLAYLTPASGTSGAKVTLRGSGFQSGSSVQFGTMTAGVTFVDAQTLQITVPNLSPGAVQVTVTNPDGTAYAFDNAFTVN
jgi:DNA-binding beta-propeller fold protein YncE